MKYTFGPFKVGWRQTYKGYCKRTFSWAVITPAGTVLATTQTRKGAAAIAEALNR